MDRTTRSPSTDFWASEQAWFERNRLTPEQLDRVYERTVGHRKLAIWRGLLKHIPRNISVLEVGSGEGLQLEFFRVLGFRYLFACDLNEEALSHNPYANAVCPADALPYHDGQFDLIFTSGLLIHIPPHRIDVVCAELARVASQWVAGYEYHSYLPVPVNWRGQSGLMWKADYPAYYRRQGLSLAKSWLLPHIDGSGSRDHAFLLTK